MKSLSQFFSRIYRGAYRAAIREDKRNSICCFVKSRYAVLRRRLILSDSCNELLFFYNSEYFLCVAFICALSFNLRMYSAAVNHRIK